MPESKPSPQPKKQHAKSISENTVLRIINMLENMKKEQENIILETSTPSEDDPTAMIVDSATAAQDDALLKGMESLIGMLKTRLDAPFTLSFSAMKQEHLKRMGIIRAGVFVLKKDAPDDDLRSRIDKTRALGEKSFWTDATLYGGLEHVENTYTNANETSARRRIDTILDRVTSMLGAHEKALIMLEKQVPLVRPKESDPSKVAGFIDYTVVVTSPIKGAVYLSYPPTFIHESMQQDIAFQVTEAKSISAILKDHIPQIVVEMVACARLLKKHFIRGTLTNGHTWIFLAVELDEDWEGAKYWESNPITWTYEAYQSKESPAQVDKGDGKHDVALVAGILSTWIPASFEAFTSDQWFIRMNQI